MNLQKLLFKKKYLLLALDHRGSLFKILLQAGEKNIENSALEFKKQIIQTLCPDFSGILLDPEIGLRAYRETNCNKPYLLCLEKSGYEEENNERLTQIQFTPSFVKKNGAVAGKLLLYFNPNYPSKTHQIKIAKKIFKECQKENLPLFLEIVVYDKEDKPINEELIVESIKIFLNEKIYPQVFKLQPPKNPDIAKQITSLLKPHNIDWIVLTQGMDFEEFKKRLKTSILAGCKGFLAGRSIWKDAVGKKGQELKKILKNQTKPCFKEIVYIALNNSYPISPFHNLSTKSISSFEEKYS